MDDDELAWLEAVEAEAEAAALQRSSASGHGPAKTNTNNNNTTNNNNKNNEATRNTSKNSAGGSVGQNIGTGVGFNDFAGVDEEEFYDEEAEAEAEAEAARQQQRQQTRSSNTDGNHEDQGALDDESRTLDSVERQDGRRCEQCGSLSLDQRMLSTFDEAICTACKLDCPGFKTISKTNAKNDYLLSDDDLYNLKFLVSSNPRRMGWSMMKLYLTKQVEARSMERWGSKENLEEERNRRVLERAKKREQRARKAFEEAATEDTDDIFQRNISKLRGEVAGDKTAAATPSPSKTKKSKGFQLEDPRKTKRAKGTRKETTQQIKNFVPKNQTYHEHSFGPAVPVEPGSDMYVKTCTECQLEVQFESF